MNNEESREKLKLTPHPDPHEESEGEGRVSQEIHKAMEDSDFPECDLMEINPDARYTPDGSFPGLES